MRFWSPVSPDELRQHQGENSRVADAAGRWGFAAPNAYLTAMTSMSYVKMIWPPAAFS
jgi:hypothetical protein